MRVIDASSIVHAWDNYPIDNFPKFWDWIDQEFSSSSLLVRCVAFDEVAHVSPNCCDWLKDKSVNRIEVTSTIAQHSKTLKGRLGITNDLYGTGIDENDIIIIATAIDLKHPLISNEGRQLSLPTKLKNYKIPAVCAMNDVKVECINVAEYIRQSKKTF